jgi:hypothetical protein
MTSTNNKERLMTVIVRRAISLAATAAVVISLAASMHAMNKGAKRPAASEFGLGPRSSAHGLYVVTLVPERELKPRKMQTVRVTVVDANGQPIDDATLAIDGGMPQHGHGLPTRPRATRCLGGGAYDIEGVRFNMGGWWEFEIAISGSRGADIVTFNLDL